MHYLAANLPVGEVARLADQVGAGLVVLSSAMNDTAEQARQAAQASHPQAARKRGRC